MRDINRIMLRGRLTADAETYDGEHSRGKFRMATNIRFKRQNGEWGERTCFHTVTCWGERGVKRCADLKKGAVVYVEGEVSITRGKDQNGVEHDYYNITATDGPFPMSDPSL